MCEGGKSSLETGMESYREGEGSAKEKVIVRDGRVHWSLSEKRG